MGRNISLRAFTLATLAFVAIQPKAASAGLVAYWSFDGCTTSDASGHGANLTAHASPSCVAGRFGNAWMLDGSTQYLDRATDPLFTPGARAWSVAAWVKSATAPATAVIVSWYRCGANPACSSADPALFALGLSGGHPYWDLRDDAAPELTLTDTQLSVTDGAWHFLVGTMNPATDSLKLYVDGALRLALNGAIGTFSSGGVPIPIEVGRWFRTGWGSPDYYFPGAIDEVRIYDNELTATSVAALFARNDITDVTPGDPLDFAIEQATPNPARGGPLAVAFTLPVSAPARLALYDVSGRVVLERSVGALGAGHHRVDLAAGRRFAPGVYLIQLTQGARTTSRHITLLR